ncbi:nuclear protein [Tulasnella sp. 419]|nr:nuclear protein [Tulasnella sp. 419]
MFDSRLLNLAATLSTAKVRELRHDGGGFDTGDFIAKMVTFMGGNRAGINDADSDVDDQFEIDLDWKKLGWRSLAYSRRAVGVDAMLGPLSFEQKKREVKKRSKQEKDDAPIVQPVEIKAEEIEKDENETSNNVLELSKMINSVASNQSVNLFKIIINPHSYSQSVENLFYLSFLIHEQRVAVEVDPQTDELMLYACEPATEDDYKDSDLRRVQSVWELDYETWQMAIETWDIREPLFPTRPTPPESSYRFYNK